MRTPARRTRRGSLTAALTAGDTITARRTFNLKDVRAYYALADEQPAVTGHGPLLQASTYGKPVVPAGLATLLFHALIANDLGFANAHVVGQMLRFPRPIYVGETVTVTIAVDAIHSNRKLLQLSLQLSTLRGVSIDGEAVVSYGPPPSPA